MSLRRLRTIAGVLAYDLLPFESRLRRGRWTEIHNRNESIEVQGHAVLCPWRFTSELHITKVFPDFSTRLMRRALRDWPIRYAGTLSSSATPEVSFLIGHRGTARLPHLLLTLRSIAAQESVPVECIVIEQDSEPRVASALPAWVRYIHQPAGENEPYRRAATFNEALRQARGRIVVPHDNDMLVPARYAAEIVRAVGQGFEAIDLKRFIFYLTPEESQQVMAGGMLTMKERSESVIQNLRGGSMALTKEAYAAIGGFDEGFAGWGGEDLELWERAETRRATRFGYLPIVHLWHAPQPEKLQMNDAPAIKRYVELASVPAEERIARLKALSSRR